MELVDLLLTVMRKPTLGFTRPTLTYGPQGYEFNGSHFGNNEQGAKQARSAYWNDNDSSIHGEWEEKEPLVLDLDLPTE